MYVHRTTVKLYDTDAAGVLFFGHQFRIAHECYEAMMASIGFSISWIVRDSEYFIPIVHAEADYKKPLFVDDPIELHLQPERIGASSYTLVHDIRGRDGTTVGTVKTVHVTINKKSGKTIPLPENLRTALQRL